MGKIKLTCKSCGGQVEREEKPAPKNKIEGKQILFNCPCGATNLRDGSAYCSEKKKKIKIRPVKPDVEPVKPGLHNPVKEPKKPAPERSEINDEESEVSPLVI